MVVEVREAGACHQFLGALCTSPVGDVARYREHTGDCVRVVAVHAALNSVSIVAPEAWSITSGQFVTLPLANASRYAAAAASGSVKYAEQLLPMSPSRDTPVTREVAPFTSKVVPSEVMVINGSRLASIKLHVYSDAERNDSFTRSFSATLASSSSPEDVDPGHDRVQ